MGHAFVKSREHACGGTAASSEDGSTRRRAIRAGLGLIAGLGALAAMLVPVAAATVPVAVAANFTGTAKDLAQAFKTATGNNLQLSFGSSGALYAQISQGAPFEVFLSADVERPKKAVSDGLGVSGTEFTYAVGKLVLYSTSLALKDGVGVLRAGRFAHLSVADAKAAPYGAAAVETIKALGLTDALQPKLVIGENISQTLQFVQSGNAELGFVALSQVMGAPGSQWQVPQDLYEPIEQGAVLLAPGKADPAARAFLDFLKSDQAVAIIEKAGYGVAQ